MAENDIPADGNWVGMGPGPLIWARPINVNKLADEVNKILDGVVSAAEVQNAILAAKARKYRRQRNGLLAIIVGVTVNSYLNARKRIEADRVNPPREM